MLTEEQIKNLKPGDPLILHGTYIQRYTDGDIVIEGNRIRGGAKTTEHKYFHPSCVSLPEQPKYNPCRLFRKGDIVRLKEWNGRCPALPEDWKCDNGLFKVHEDEKFNSSVEITRENSKTVYIAPICFLELVTPVEELEPYSIDPENTNVLFKRGKKFATFEDDDEAQEMCDRLNAEYRKEQSND